MPTRVVSTPHPRRYARLLAAACVAAIAYLTLTPAAGEPGTSFFCLVCGSRGGVDAVLNVLLFAPLGFALVLCGLRWPRAVIAMTLLSAAIECTQFLAIPGRDATFGDIVMNMLGGTAGVAIAYRRCALLHPSPRFATAACVAWSALWLVVQSVASFAFALSIPDTRYYGQIARSFASMATFAGTVIDARVGTIPVPDYVIADSVELRALLRRNATVSTVVIPDGATARLAPILRIADRNRDEVVILGQDGRSAIFGVRTGAQLLRLRPPLFRMPDALAPTADGDQSVRARTVRVAARYGPTVRMDAERSAATRARQMKAGPELGWTLVLPAQWYIDGSAVEGWITALWVFGWLFPLGFWVAQRGGPSPHGRRIVRLIVITLLLAGLFLCGLASIPIGFGVAPATRADWLAALAALVVGARVGRFAQRRTAGLTM